MAAPRPHDKVTEADASACDSENSRQLFLNEAMPAGQLPLTVHVTRLPIQLLPGPVRLSGGFFGRELRTREIIKRLSVIPEAEIESLMISIESSFEPLHPGIDEVFLRHFELVKHHILRPGEVGDRLWQLIGACFTMEYASNRIRTRVFR